MLSAFKASTSALPNFGRLYSSYKNGLTRSETIAALSDKPVADDKALFKRADDVTRQVYGDKVYLRGIIEFSNHCAKNCHYCGIRRDQTSPERYEMSQDDILQTVQWAHSKRYPGILLQSGEVPTQDRVEFVADTLRRAREITGDDVKFILSLGELTDAQYGQLREAGADRYLLRMETSNPSLYATLHPQDGHHDWLTRLKCVKSLVSMGYQVATGVMTGLPGQTTADLADDVDMMRELGVDMVGLGPYVPQNDTPTAADWMAERGRDTIDLTEDDKAGMLLQTIRMLATCRLSMPDINMAAATALQALREDGREWALQSGANVVMPILTPEVFRANYQLYTGKPNINDGAEQSMQQMVKKVESVGKVLAFGDVGDPAHYTKRMARE